MNGRFITFEGLDGSGKSTHLKGAAEWLRTRGIEVIETHEPGGSELGQAIRGIFLDRRWGRMDGLVELLLVSASRRQHLLEVIEPALDRGTWVLCDRFSDSTWAYQGAGRGVPERDIAMSDALATSGRRPDVTLLFDLPAADARLRGHSPKRQAERSIDRLDEEELEFYRRVREGFLARADQEPHRFRILDSSGSREATAAQLERCLAELLVEAAR